MNYNIIISGFGGQGVLFSGKILATIGLIENKEVTWFPSYGPEMRGGVANCSVCISDKPIGSPLVINPNLLIAMNLPSYNKFIEKVSSGGIAILDKSLIDVKNKIDDILIYEIDATEISQSENLNGLSNMILLGKTIKETGLTSLEVAEKAIDKCVSKRKENLLELNKKALKLGYEL